MTGNQWLATQPGYTAPAALPSAWTTTAPGTNTTVGAANMLNIANQYAGQPYGSIPTSASGLTWGGAPNWWSNPGVSNIGSDVGMTVGGPVPGTSYSPQGMTFAQQNAFNQYAAGAGAQTPAATPSLPQSLSGPQMQSDMIAAHLPAWANGDPGNRSPYMLGQVPGMQQQVATARNALAANGTPYPSAGIPGQQLGMGDASGMTGQSSMMGGGMGPLASAAMAGLGG